MIRIVIENVFVFLIPTILYIGWIAFVRNDWPGLGRVIKDAPISWLFAFGVVLMLTTLALVASEEGNKPSQSYVPPSFDGDHLKPGHAADPSPADNP